MKPSVLFFFGILFLFAKDIQPIATLEVSGMVSDMVEENGYLYVATDNGTVDIVDLTTQKIARQIHFEPILRSDGTQTPARVHAIDRFRGKTVMVTSAPNAYRYVWLEENGSVRKVVDANAHMMPKHAFFDQEGRIILGGFGSEIVLYDTDENYFLYRRGISESTMGGMVLDRDRQKMLVSDESGTVRLIDINTSRLLHTFEGQHVDNIYRVAYANEILISAGQDRRVGVHIGTQRAYHLKSDFLVYAVAISPSGKTALYSSGTEHALQLFDPVTGRRADRLVGHHATPGKIIFVTEKAIISAGDEKVIYFWKIP